jgi:tetratricopeptide (TPR) repeat protein
MPDIPTLVLQRFGRAAPLLDLELRLIDLFPELFAPLPVVSAPDVAGLFLLEDLLDPLFWAKTLQKLGVTLYGEGDVAINLAIFSLSLRCWLQFLPPNARETLTAIRHWAIAERDAGDHGDYEVALAALEYVVDELSIRDPEDQELLDARNDRALLLLDLGRAVEARSLLTPLIRDFTYRFGSLHPRTLTAKSNLADALRLLGRYRSAMALMKRTLKARRKSPALGPEHPETLIAANNLAHLLLLLGDFPEARRLQEEVLSIRERTLPNHRDTLTARANLAATLSRSGDFGDRRRAAELEQKILEQYSTFLHEYHPDVLIAMHNWALSLRDIGELDEACRLLRKTLGIWQATDTAMHDDALSTMTSLAELLREAGEFEEALSYAEKAFLTRRTRLGPLHSATLQSQGAFAAALNAAGRQADALESQRDYVKVLRAHIGPTHYDTIIAVADLARLLSDQGELDEAVTLFSDALEASENALGATHPHTLLARLSLAEAIHASGDSPRALKTVQPTIEHLMTQQLFDVQGFELAAHATALLYAMDAWQVLPALFEKTSAAMRISVELLSIEASHRAIPLFHGLHDTWLAYCFRASPADTLLALAPLHGIESLSRTLVELAESPDILMCSPTRSAFVRSRKELADLRLHLQQINAELRGSLDEGRLRALTSIQADLIRKEQSLLNGYRATRQALQDEDPDILGRLQVPQIDIKEIELRLSECEAAVFIIRFRNMSCAALTIDRSGVRQCALPHLDACMERMAAYMASYRALHSRSALREYLQDMHASGTRDMEEFSDIRETTLEELHAIACASFWQPVLAQLPSVESMHIVSAPDLHTLPLEAANPGIATHYYPGLPGFLSAFAGRTGQELQYPLGVDVAMDCSWSSLYPIPFARAETELVGSVFEQSRIMTGTDLIKHLDSGKNQRKVHVACHGIASGEHERRYSVLLIDWDSDTRLDPRAIGQYPGVIDEVFCSACIGGIVAQRVATDAVGVVSAFQMRGVPVVIACIAPMPDFYMPLLAAFYWHARKAGQAPSAALTTSKHQLLSGDWPNVLLVPIEDAYRRTIEDILERGRSSTRKLAAYIAAYVPPDLVGEFSLNQAATLSCSTEVRHEWSRCVAGSFVERRARLSRHDIEHVCAFTLCFGDSTPITVP